MFRLVLFIKKIYVLLLFVLLESLSLHFYASSTSYTKSKLLTFSNSCVGTLNEGISYVGHYFTLGRENRMLAGEIAGLRNQLEMFRRDPAVAFLEAGEVPPYQYAAARVVSSSVTRQENYLTLDKGLRDDVEADMAVISPDGCIVGYVLSCSEKFAACISVLNTKFRTSGKFSKAPYVGSVHWNGRSQSYLTLSDIPRHAEMARGDTILTSDYSLIFPSGVMIGTVEDWILNEQTYTYDVRVRLATDLSSLREVLLVRYADAAERSALESSVEY